MTKTKTSKVSKKDGKVTKKSCNLNIRVPREILDALDRAAGTTPEMNVSRYVREGLRARLEADGFLSRS